MSSIKFNEAIASWLESDTHDDAHNPFVKDNGRIFLKYDAVRIEVAAKDNLEVSLMYAGRAYHTYTIPHARAGLIGIIEQLHGRAEVYLNREGETP